MHRFMARGGVAIVGAVSAATGLLAIGYAARAPSLHSLPTPLLLGAAGLVLLPVATVFTRIAHRRGAVETVAAHHPDPERQVGPVSDPTPDRPPGASGFTAPAPAPPPQRHTEPREGTRAARVRQHRRQVRHAGR